MAFHAGSKQEAVLFDKIEKTSSIDPSKSNKLYPLEVYLSYFADLINDVIGYNSRSIDVEDCKQQCLSIIIEVHHQLTEEEGKGNCHPSPYKRIEQALWGGLKLFLTRHSHAIYFPKYTAYQEFVQEHEGSKVVQIESSGLSDSSSASDLEAVDVEEFVKKYDSDGVFRYFLEGYNKNQISKLLGIPYHEVCSKLIMIRQRMQKALS